MKISGPVSVTILQVGNNHIIIWGDIHGDKRQYCRCQVNNKNCQLIASFLRRVQDNYDLFIESPWYTQEERNDLLGKQFVEVNALRSIANTFFQEMYFHGKTNKHTRVHFTDIRTERKIRPLTDIINNLITLLYEATPTDDYTFIHTLQQYDTTDKLYRFVDGIINDTTHKIYKQLNKLTEFEQKTLIRFHQDMCRTLLTQTKTYDKSHYHLFHTQKNNYYNDILNVFNCLLLWLSHLKDVYTICRMLYYMNKNRVIISYDGDYHTQIYNKFFTKYYPNTKTLWQYGFNTRCVSIPQHILRKVFPNTPI